MNLSQLFHSITSVNSNKKERKQNYTFFPPRKYYIRRMTGLKKMWITLTLIVTSEIEENWEGSES